MKYLAASTSSTIFKDSLSHLIVLPSSMKRILLLCFIYFVGLFAVYVNYLSFSSNLFTFAFLYFITLIFAFPTHAISPLSIFYIYYGLWYVLAPYFAERYQEDVLSLSEYSLALAFAYTVFGLGTICIIWGERFAMQRSNAVKEIVHTIALSTKRWVLILYVTSSLFIVLIILYGGGFSVWMTDPGDAFLNRSGSGLFVILSHFSSLALASLSGYLAYTTKRKTPLIFFIIWVALTSPVHGSKFQISLLIVLLFLPWIKDLRLLSVRSFVLGGSLIGIFFLGLYFRNFTWIDAETILPYSLNYFTALENLAISLRDFDPQFMKTFFLPFVKFLTPFGISDISMYYDMNHMLTDIYYPKAWEIRATEQWPVETDIYLNFYFVGGLPVVGVYLFFIGWIYGVARRSNSLGAWFSAVAMTLFMVSHLRGSLINHTDFYMYPYFFFMYLLLRRVSLYQEK